MTVDELDAALRGHYQDYEWYVLKQLHIDDGEEGESEFGFHYLPGISNAVPSMIIPRGWQYDAASPNVSEGIRLAVEKIVSTSTRAPVPRSYFERIPWKFPLCDRVARGTMRWRTMTAVTGTDMGDGEPL